MERGPSLIRRIKEFYPTDSQRVWIALGTIAAGAGFIPTCMWAVSLVVGK